MFKAITYDQPVKKRVRPNKYRAEIEAIHEFNSSKHTNMLMEYDSGGGARNSYGFLKKYLAEAKMPLEVKVRNVVFVVIERKKINESEEKDND